ncbi:MAG TPA: hypothetical protein VGL08_09980 [Paraburkholderia sp.]|jgi:hypothetical protein
MTLPSASTSILEALPNPRGGAVRVAEAALADALRAHDQHGDTALPLLHATHALRDAGWLAARRFADTLVLASPLTADEQHTGGPIRTSFGNALHAFGAALGRCNLRELSCAPSLFGHYRALSALVAQHTPGFSVSFEDLALAGRPIPPVTLRSQPAERLAQVRARYEAALLPVLRAQTGERAMSAATLVVSAALDELDACFAQLAGPDPYDFWRLAAGCARTLRVSGHLSGDADARRFYARCNLALAEQARGIQLAPRSLVRATLALLWRDYALFGAAAEDTEQVELLRDYGLTVVWHVVGTSASEALWEAGAVQAETVAAHAAATRELGAVTVNAYAYEDFLQTADASIAALSEHARAADNPQKADPSAALQAGDAAYRLGASACALGLGHVALLSDALGLAWRRRAHAGVATPAVRAHGVVDAPDARALEQAAEALRAMLHKIAAGIAPPQSNAALASLTKAIELGGA